jgi:putative nucleotidyltransferase with HDIG domain
VQILFLTDTPARARRLAWGLVHFGSSQTVDVLDPYQTPSGFDRTSVRVIVSEVSFKKSEPIAALRRHLDALQSLQKPYLCILHEGGPRSHAQATALKATYAVPIGHLAQRIARVLPLASATTTGTSAARLAAQIEGARLTMPRILGLGRAGERLDAALVARGAGLIENTLRETGVRARLEIVWQFDDVTHQHCLVVAGLAAGFAQHLGLPRVDCERLTQAALLHDVGKARIPLAILNKPGRLEDGERRIVEAHPVIGYEMLQGSRSTRGGRAARRGRLDEARTAVDVQGLAVHEAVVHQEDDRRTGLVGRAEAPLRQPLGERCHVRIAVGTQRASQERRVGGAGRQRVHPHRRQFQREAPSEGFHCGRGSGQDRGTLGARPIRQGAGDEGHGAVLREPAVHGAQRVNCGPDPLVEGAPQVFDLGLQDLAGHEGAGEQDEVVDARDVGERRGDGAGPGHVRGAPPGEAVLRRDALGAPGVEADHDDPGARGRGLPGRREADAGGASEDDDGAILKGAAHDGDPFRRAPRRRR